MKIVLSMLVCVVIILIPFKAFCSEASFNTHYNKGLELLKNGYYDLALNELLIANRLNSNDSDVHCELGLAYAHKNNVQEAIKHYEISIKLNPKSDCTYINLGEILVLKKLKLNEGIQMFLKAEELKPDDVYVHYTLGFLYTQKCFYKDALKEFDRVLELDPHYMIPIWNIELKQNIFLVLIFGNIFNVVVLAVLVIGMCLFVVFRIIKQKTKTRKASH